MKIIQKYLVGAITVMVCSAVFSSCSMTEWHYDDVLSGIEVTCDGLDYVLDETYTDIINDYADNISKREKGAEAEFSDFMSELTITYPYNYFVSGMVSGLFGVIGDIFIEANDETIRSKSKSELLDKIVDGLDIETMLVYISLVQKEGSVVYCYETSGFEDKEIELTTKNLQSILSNVDYNVLAGSSE